MGVAFFTMSCSTKNIGQASAVSSRSSWEMLQKERLRARASAGRQDVRDVCRPSFGSCARSRALEVASGMPFAIKRKMPAKVMPLGLPSGSLFQKEKAPSTASSVPQLAVPGALAFKPLVKCDQSPPPTHTMTGWMLSCF